MTTRGCDISLKTHKCFFPQYLSCTALHNIPSRKQLNNQVMKVQSGTVNLLRQDWAEPHLCFPVCDGRPSQPPAGAEASRGGWRPSASSAAP